MNSASGLGAGLDPGARFPDFTLCDHAGNAEVACSRLLSVSVDAPLVNAALRAGLGARWTFLSDEDRSVQPELGLRETTDTLNDPYVPAVGEGSARGRAPPGRAGHRTLR